jgi:hypothetical protein
MLREDLKHITVEDLLSTNQISTRTRNCCDSIGLNSLYEIVLYFEEYKSFFANKFRIKNAGRKTCLELDELCTKIIPTLEIETGKRHEYNRNEEIIQIIEELSEVEREMLVTLANLILNPSKAIKEKINNYGDYCSDSFVVEFYENHGHLPMFWILEQHIINSKSRETEILITTFNIIQNRQVISIDEIAEKHNLSRERVRQIRYDVFRKTFEITDEITEYKGSSDLIKYARILQNKDDWTYILDLIKETHLVNQAPCDIQIHLQKEKCNLSIKCVLQIIAYIFRDKFTLWGGFEISSRGKIWENTFLIRKEFLDIFDFEKMREEFSNILINNTVDYFLDIDQYITDSQCWLKFDFDKIDSIASIAKYVLLHEFGLYTEGIDNTIKIPAIKGRSPFDVIYEVLQQNGHPMHLEEIFIEFKKLLPEHKYTEAAQLRPYLQKHEAIAFRNRKSVFMLKEWEHVRSGTIRDAIVDFLMNNDSPQSAENITKSVLQYFPETNIASVRTTMFNDTKKRFSFFGNNLFGLTDKKYPLEYEEIEPQEIQRKSFEQRLTDLERFIIENEHFPFSSSEDKEEESLSRWWYRIINGKQQIKEIQQAEVDRIKEQYANYETDKNAYEWHLNYNKFRIFLLENWRVPAASGVEKFLYGWLRRAKEDFLNGRLNEEQRTKYIELAKLI